MTTNTAEARDGVRQELLGMLLDKVEADRFPSATMLDLVEELVGPEEIGLYAEVLMSKIREDTYPSMDLIRRISALT
jgi:hypothetical protein